MRDYSPSPASLTKQSQASPHLRKKKKKKSMAMAKLTALILLLAFIAVSTLSTTALATQYQLDASRYGPGSLKSYQCSPECNRRCKQTRYKKPCLFFCNKCCNKCLCVPPGYYGHKAVCPCYNNWKTKEGGPKCP